MENLTKIAVGATFISVVCFDSCLFFWHNGGFFSFYWAICYMATTIITVTSLAFDDATDVCRLVFDGAVPWLLL